MPGTMGSLFSMIIIILLKHFLNNIFFICIFILLFFISLKLIEIYSKSINKHEQAHTHIYIYIYQHTYISKYINNSKKTHDISNTYIGLIHV